MYHAVKWRISHTGSSFCHCVWHLWAISRQVNFCLMPLPARIQYIYLIEVLQTLELPFTACKYPGIWNQGHNKCVWSGLMLPFSHLQMAFIEHCLNVCFLFWVNAHRSDQGFWTHCQMQHAPAQQAQGLVYFVATCCWSLWSVAERQICLYLLAPSDPAIHIDHSLS